MDTTPAPIRLLPSAPAFVPTSLPPPTPRDRGGGRRRGGGRGRAATAAASVGLGDTSGALDGGPRDAAMPHGDLLSTLDARHDVGRPARRGRGAAPHVRPVRGTGIVDTPAVGSSVHAPVSAAVEHVGSSIADLPSSIAPSVTAPPDMPRGRGSRRGSRRGGDTQHGRGRSGASGSLPAVTTLPLDAASPRMIGGGGGGSYDESRHPPAATPTPAAVAPASAPVAGTIARGGGSGGRALRVTTRGRRGGATAAPLRGEAANPSSSAATPMERRAPAELPAQVPVPPSSVVPGDTYRGTLASELRDETYNCVVCFEPVRRVQSVWTCSACWGVFHFDCVKTWREKSSNAAAAAAPMDAGPPSAFQLQRAGTGVSGRAHPAVQLRTNEPWRCPGCSSTHNSAPQERCWCGKVRKPEVSLDSGGAGAFGGGGAGGGITPHSCGGICGRSRAHGCPHRCETPCHPGPCPPCAALGPVRTCGCGRTSSRLRCGVPSTSSAAAGAGGGVVDGCGAVCGAPLDCGIRAHRCERLCHRGCSSQHRLVPAIMPALRGARGRHRRRRGGGLSGEAALPEDGFLHAAATSRCGRGCPRA